MVSRLVTVHELCTNPNPFMPSGIALSRFYEVRHYWFARLVPHSHTPLQVTISRSQSQTPVDWRRHTGVIHKRNQAGYARPTRQQWSRLSTQFTLKEEFESDL
jgi:hypothetical protein